MVLEKKCDRNYLMSKFAYVHNIQGCVKQEVDMPQNQNLYVAYAKAGRGHKNVLTTAFLNLINRGKIKKFLAKFLHALNCFE